MSRLFFGALAAACAVACAGPAAAANVFTGVTIEDVSIDGVLYDVTFKGGLLDDIYPGRVFTFTTATDALEAVDAVVARAEFQALVSSDFYGLFVPYDMLDANHFLSALAGGFVGRTTGNGDVNIDYTLFSDGKYYSYATFEASVPEPGAWALMMLGFGGVGAALRRRTAASAAV